MARGWESKNVEEQQGKSTVPKPSPTSVPREEQLRQRRLQGLQMQRERILSERTSSPHRRSALEVALGEIERELQQLGWTVHL